MEFQSKQLWFLLCQRIAAQGNLNEIYNNLAKRYIESHRAYHTLEHIKECIAEFEQVRHLAFNANAIEWALWYHDAIYDTKAKDNEERSAKLAMEAVRSALLPDNFGKSVVSLIMATKHSEVPTDKDARLIVDVDLSILGQPEEKFNEYERQIRKEYEWIPKNEFIAKRSAVLKSFLDRQVIYLTRFFYEKYEVLARQNIARSLKKLNNFVI